MVPLALRAGFGKRVVSDRLLATAAVCSVLPDIDVLAFHFGILLAALDFTRRNAAGQQLCLYGVKTQTDFDVGLSS